MQEKELEDLIQIARVASENCYAPYSKFPVGCLLITNDGQQFVGCNVENISFGLTNCAERTAVFSAVAGCGPKMKISRIIIFTPTDHPISPCGACRQVLREFGDSFEIICACNSKQVLHSNISELLPDSPDIPL